ncbi:MAG: two-component system response regulator [Myxococcales bacterium]|nr:two-component system response regulator [Myxococcales bacterium]
MDTLGFGERLQHVQHRVQSLADLGREETHDRLIRVFVELLPKLFHCERCSIFLADPEDDTLGAKYGTGISEGEIEVSDPKSIAGRVATSGEAVIDNEPNPAAPSHQQAEKATGFQLQNILCVPVRSRAMGSEVVGVIEVLNKEGGFSDQDQERLEGLADGLSHAIESVWAQDRLVALGAELSRELASLPDRSRSFIASDPQMIQILDEIEALGPTPAAVLITGENGTGKELVARRLHQLSGDPGRPFVAVNCAAIPENLIESEFFGHERGAFTGAEKSKPGFLEMAASGTLFLDEVGEMPLALQAKLLRALEQKEGRRVGGQRLVHYHFRLLSATNQDLEAKVADGSFREDLYYRLFSVQVTVPPLRERLLDIPLMLERFVAQTSEAWQKPIRGIAPEVVERFEAYHWPGNVRQLRREAERLVALTPPGEAIELNRCSPELRQEVAPRSLDIIADGSVSLKDQMRAFEQRIVDATLKHCRGKKSEAARCLGISRQALHAKLKDRDRD